MKDDTKEFIQALAVGCVSIVALLVSFGLAIAIVIGIPAAAIVWIIETVQQ